MSEITKLYENAGVEKLLYCDICKAQEHALGLCAETKCEPFYPPFTTEKQLKILKIIVHSYGFNALDKPIWGDGWAVAIARLVNIYWEVLSEKEKQQVKGILE